MERHRHIFEVTADFEFVTQAFIDGAESVTELRSASVMGVLRFWWRAMAWRAVLQHSDADHNARLATLRAWEDALFGATRTGVGAFTMMIEPAVGGQKPLTIAKADIRSVPSGKAFHATEDASLAYVTGVWVGHKRERSIQQGSAFRLRLLSRRDPRQGPVPNAPSLIEAVRILGLIGGLGARSRRGFGSLVLTGLELRKGAQCMEAIAVPRTYKDYCAELASLLEATGDSMPPFTAFGPSVRILLHTKTSGTATSAQAAALLDMRAARSYRNASNIGGIVRSSDTVDGHDWFKSATSQGWRFSTPASLPLDPVPKKVAFGLPLGFHSRSSAGVESDTKITPLGMGMDRRASPLLLHVHRLEGKFVAVWVFVPAVFLESSVAFKIVNNIKLNNSKQKSTNIWNETCEINFEAVETFVEGLAKTKRYSVIRKFAPDCQADGEEKRT